MGRATMDRIADDFDSKFRFVLLAARRAEQLIRGAEPRVSMKSPKVARVAMQELLEARVDWGYGPPPEVEGELSEAEAEAEAQEASN
jgi:DNA-directed RNA polymerase subunit omega